MSSLLPVRLTSNDTLSPRGFLSALTAAVLMVPVATATVAASWPPVSITMATSGRMTSRGMASTTFFLSLPSRGRSRLVVVVIIGSLSHSGDKKPSCSRSPASAASELAARCGDVGNGAEPADTALPSCDE